MLSGRGLSRLFLAIAAALALSACGLNPQPEIPSDEGTGGAAPGGGAESDAGGTLAVGPGAPWPAPQTPAGGGENDKRQNGAADSNNAARPGIHSLVDAGSDADAEAPPTVTM